MSDFYEDDEPASKVAAAFERGQRFETALRADLQAMRTILEHEPYVIHVDDSECILRPVEGCVRRDRRHLEAAHGGKAQA
jgi:hypothetical protein